MALAMTALSARLWWSHSSNSVRCKDFGAFSVRWSGCPGSRVTLRRDVLGFAAGKRNSGPKPRSGTQARRTPKVQRIVEDDDDDDVEKALEALFAQLEMDLNSEEGDGGDDQAEFTDEELTQMTKELEAAFNDMEEEDPEEGDSGLVDMELTDGVYSQGSGTSERQQEDEDDDEEEEEDFDDEDDEQRMVPLEKWQLRKLAAAVEQGRRNVNIKSLAAELGMDRSDVLSFLRDPPPELLLMSAQFANEAEEAAASEEVEAKVEKAPRTATSRKQPVPPPTPSGGPQSPRNWHGNKRLKKEHVATFERVYRQTNRPSNTMIENLVNLTHVPRKRVVQWFDDRRAENQPKKKSFEDAPEN